MNNKIINLSRKKDLKILVEDYLERDHLQLYDFLRNRPHKAMFVFSRTFQLLCAPDDDVHDLTMDELKGAILDWHALLTPVWNKIKSAFIDYRENILPDRKKHQNMIDEVNNPSSSLSPFKDIVNNGDDPSLLNTATHSFKIRRSPITINLSLASDKFSISLGGIRVIDQLLLQLKDAPTDIFSTCDHCGKIIIITRKGKRYHSGCASKAKQKELWTKDPDGCREKERKRYHQRVKGK